MSTSENTDTSADGEVGGPDQDKAPHPIDIHVGLRVRERRRELNASQQWLAAHLAISFQQLQKYERGVNRISASKLYEVASALEVTITYFFEGIEAHEEVVATPGQAIATSFLKSDEGVELVSCFQRLTPKAQKIVTAAVKGFAEIAGKGRSRC